MKEPPKLAKDIASVIFGIPGQEGPKKLTVLMISYFLFPAVVFAFAGAASAQKPTPPQPDALHIGVAVATTIAAVILSRRLMNIKKNEAGQQVLMPLLEFTNQFTIIGSCCVLNALITIFTGRGMQIYMGLGLCYALILATLLPVYLKLIPLYKQAEPAS
jgi:hypothetical protein